MSYRHVVISEFGGPEKLQVVEEVGLPEPGPHEVRVKVLAAGTGFTDTIVRQGQYVAVKEKPPFTLGYEWFGIVDKLGSDVSSVREGQYVADMPVIGAYTEYLCVDADQLIPAPDGLDPAEAVCMGLAYATAYQMLTRHKTLLPGMSCVVHAAGGSVGTALLELGRLMGLKVYGIASTGKKDLVESFDAIHIDYRNEDFVQRIAELSEQGEGVDVVFDTIGGKSWARSYRCLKKGGQLIAFGVMQHTTGEESVLQSAWGFLKLKFLWPLLPDGKSATFYDIQRRRIEKPQEYKEDVVALLDLLSEGKLHPKVAARLPLDQAEEAHRRIDRADVQGKIALICNAA